MRLIYAVVLLLCAQAVAVADLKVTTRNTAAGQSTESTIYIKGQRQRTESPGTASVYQCDLKRVIHINDRARKYFVARLDGDGGAAAAADEPADQTPRRRGGIVTYTVTATDTGERRQLFGYTARRIKTTAVMDAPEGTCNPGRVETETDGWYIDLQVAFNCSADRPTTPPRPPAGGCQDEIRFKHTGTARLGFPVLLTTKMKLPSDGEPVEPEEAAMMERMMTSTLEVTEISSTTLDAALFGAPAGYREASSMSELYGPAADPRPQDMPAGGRTPHVSAPGDEETAPRTTAARKQPGVVRIGVAAVSNNTGRGISAESLRQTLVAEISAARVEAVPLGRDAAAEAVRLECDFILYTDLTALKQLAAGKVGGILGRVTGVGAPAGEKYEARVEFRLVTAGGGPTQLLSSVTAKESGVEESVTAALLKEARAVSAAAARTSN